MYSYFHPELVMAILVLFSRVIRPIKCQSKPTTSRECVGSCYIISMPASAQHKWRLSRQYWIHSLKSQISCAFRLPRKPGLRQSAGPSENPGVCCLMELWVISLSRVSFLWVMELLGGSVKKDRAGTRRTAAGKTVNSEPESTGAVRGDTYPTRASWMLM